MATLEEIKYCIIPELYEYLKDVESTEGTILARIKALEDAQPESTTEPAENTEPAEPSNP